MHREYASLDQLPLDRSDRQVLKYTYALGLFRAEFHDLARDIALELVTEYFEQLELTAGDVTFQHQEHILAQLTNTPELPETLKRLADSLDLTARAYAALGSHPGLYRLHAFKFYKMAGAYDSSLKVGQEIVDDLVEAGELLGARRILENFLLPLVREARIVDRVVPIRGQYAVVLAYCGAFAEAQREIRQLQAYESGLTSVQRIELSERQLLIARLVELAGSRETMRATTMPNKVGRNQPCPCGSSRKFKKCHGASRT